MAAMRNWLATSLIQRQFFLLFLALLSLTGLHAQTTVVINTGTAGTPAYNAGPIYRSSASSAFDASRYAYLYTQAELAAAGIVPGSIITQLGWVKNNTATSTGGGIFRIFMKNSTTAAFSNATETWANLNSGAVMVYENLSQVVPATATPNYITFNLTSPFAYTGGSLEISTEWDINQVSGNPSTGTFDWLWSTVTDRIYGQGNTTLAPITTLSSTTNSITTIDNRRPFIQITFASGTGCSGTPNAGTAQTSAAVVCTGVPFTLSITGSTSASGISYQWQSSTDNVNWSNIPFTTTSFNTSQTVSTYYRAIVTCTNGGASDTTNFVLVTTPSLVSGTFTINSALPTAGTNFNSFNDAYNYIKCGIGGPVVFNVVSGSGPYTEQLIMQPVPGASATNTVTFNGNGSILTFLSSNTNERAVIKLDGADHITFDSLVITAQGTTTSQYGFGVHLINDADSNTIRKCTINIDGATTSTNYAGIVVSASATSATTGPANCDYNTFSQNNINGGYYGITLIGNSTTAVGNNKIIDNTIRNWYLYGIYVTGSFNTLIEGNQISRTNRTNSSGSIYGVYFTGLSVRAKVSKNFIHSFFDNETSTTNDGYAVYFTGVDALAGAENIVSNNVVYNMKGNGSLYGLYNASSDNVWYFHNTISLDDLTSTHAAGEVTRGFHQTTLAAGIELKNNIFTVRRTGAGNKHALYFNTATTTYVSNYNDLFIGTGATYFTGYNGVNRSTLADWQTASTQDANSVAIQPIYTDVATGNLKPTANALNDLGTPVGILTDVLNDPRSTTTPDIGAYEFAIGPCNVPPNPGTSVTSATGVICPNTLVNLNLTGYTGGVGQTYQWLSAPTLTGPWTPVSAVLTSPSFDITTSTTLYYKAVVTCSGISDSSVAIQIVVATPLPGGTYTINSGAVTGGTNFQSFNAAYDRMKCGIAGPIVINVLSGTGPYNEQLIIDSIPGTSAINTITFNGNGNTIAYSSSIDAEKAVIKLRRADHITFDSLVIDATGTGTNGFGVHLTNNADSNTIRNCTIKSSTTATTLNFAGIAVSASETSATTTGNTLCDGNSFEDNNITGGYYGITLVGSSTVSVQNNKITGNTIKDIYSYGIYLMGNFNTLVEGNDISRPTRTSVTTFYGIYATGLSIRLNISKNRIHNPFDGNLTSTSIAYGIYFTGVDAIGGAENKVVNNLVYNFNGNGTQYGIYNASSDNVFYYHNTVSLDNTAASTSDAYGFYQTTQASGIDLKNNIFSVTRAGDGDKYALFFNTATTTFTSNNNAFYVAGQNSFLGDDATTVHATLADWQAATSQDAASVFANPYFTNTAIGDLEPRTALIDNKGTNVGITTDIEGTTRSTTTPDPGAYEFIIPPCTAPPAQGTATANPASGICMGAMINLSLTGVNTVVSGQTYQWQYSTSSTGPWTNIGTPLNFADTTIEATATLYYRVLVTCSGQSTASLPVQVILNPALLSGFYTINPAIPASATNFQSFTAAVAALDCGITGFVTFNVAPGTYNEQVRMRRVYGASNTSRVTFQSANGNPASVILNYDATAAANYVLRLDSASFITYKNMTVSALDTVNARVIELANTASYDSILNCIITMPPSTSTANTSAGIYSGTLRGGNHVITGNTITGGSSSIYFAGASTTNVTQNNLIDSNTVSGSYFYGIYAANSRFTTVKNNTVNRTAPTNTTMYGIYLSGLDSVYQVISNKININGVTNTTAYGLYMTGNNARAGAMGRVANNIVTATSGNTATLYGLYQTGSTFNNTVNNVITISTTGPSSYGLYNTGGGDINFHNNSVNSTATSATNNYAAYFANTSGNGVDVRNNIFAHNGGGRAMFAGNAGFVFSDYNLYYTTGATLLQSGSPAATYANLNAWQVAAAWDYNSLVFKPAFTSNTNLSPDIADSTVWGIHGRGVQIAGNNTDINNNPRPTTLTAGVPDLGAYEFLPTVAPMPLQGTPIAAAPGTTQVFMMGTDTVSKITWRPGSVVPANIAVRRYSGVLPAGTTPTQKTMYFYTKVDAPGLTNPSFDIRQFYVESWLGFIPSESVIRLGRTDASNAWLLDRSSSVDTLINAIRRDTLNFMDRFTGLSDSTIAPPPPPVFVQQLDSSNRGRQFWVAYGHHYGFSSNSQDMVLYLSAEQPANVQVRVNGTNYVRNYIIPANTAITSQIIPKAGLFDARILDEGKYSRSISISSDVPIVAYAHIFDGSNSGAGMLLPTGVYGYDYVTLNSRQFYPTGGAGSYSWFNVIADRDSTLLEITPSVATKGGRPAGVPFTVMLMRGEVYNVMGTQASTGLGTDLTGSRIKAVPNASGKCYPFAVFAGSSRTAICNNTNGDNNIQQVFPSQAWGTKYATFATANSTSNTLYNSNMFRVMVKDTLTVVRKNGAILPSATMIRPGNYYEFSTTQGNGANGAIYIEADQPVLVAQYMVSTSADECPGVTATGNGDPELMYISPIEQGIKKAVFYNTTENSITSNYINVVVPTAALPSLQIDGGTTFTDVFAHPFLPGYTAIRHNLGGTARQHTITCDSAFTAITYGLGSVESYGYNAGTLVKNLNALPNITNTFNTSGGTNDYTCAKTPFKFSIWLSVKPTTLTWQFSQVANLSPNTDVVQNNPAPVDSVFNNGRWFYKFTLTQDYLFSQTGAYNVPILITHPSIEGCNNSFERLLTVNVIAAPIVNFATTFSGCVGDAVQFAGSGNSANGVTLTTWNWNFGDNTTGTGQNTTKIYTAPGTYQVNMRAIGTDGCVGDTTKPVVVNARPTVNVVNDSLATCPGSNVTFTVQNPAANTTYNWYTVATGGTSIHTGTSYTANNITATTVFFVEAVQNGCASTTRRRVVASIRPALTVPVVAVDSLGTNMVRFRWNAVPNATGYEVSINGGTTWITPSSGATGLTHTITGLQPLQQVSLIVRALGGCQEVRSLQASAQTLPDDIYIPNAFTPNGDGLNDVLRVYGYVIQDIQFSVFNQWGEKIFESRNQNTGWDGRYKGKDQPSGVYMYVCRIVLRNGTTIYRKGSINLIR